MCGGGEGGGCEMKKHHPAFLFVFFIFLYFNLEIITQAVELESFCRWGVEGVCCVYVCVCLTYCASYGVRV